MLKNKLFKNWIAVALIALQLSGLFPSSAQGAPVPIARPASKIQIADFHVPERLGRIQTRSNAKSGKTLIVIEDAHAAADAQKSIWKLIEDIRARYGSFVLHLEGLSETPNLALEHSFPDRDWLRKKIESDVESQNIGGGAAALILSDKLIPRSSEDRQLYLKAVRLYQNALKNQSLIFARLDRAQEVLNRSKQKAYPAEAQPWDKYLTDDSLDGLQHILEAPISGLIKKYPHLHSVRKQVQIQGFLKRPAVMRFWQGFLDRRAPASLKEEFRSGSVSVSQSARRMEAALSDAAVLKFNPLEKRLYVFALRAEKNWKEIQTAELAVEYQDFLIKKLSSLFTKSAQHLLLKQTLRLRLLKKLARLELSWAEWQEVKRMRLERPEWSAFKEFYAVQFEREQQMQRKIKASFKDSDTVVFVTGGFHRAGFDAFANQQNWNYAVVSPDIQSLEGSDRYADLMRGNVDWRSEMVAEKGQINLQKSYWNYLIKSYAKDHPNQIYDLLLHWRKQLIFKLADRKQLHQAVTVAGPIHKWLTEFMPEPTKQKFRTEWLKLQNLQVQTGAKALPASMTQSPFLLPFGIVPADLLLKQVEFSRPTLGSGGMTAANNAIGEASSEVRQTILFIDDKKHNLELIERLYPADKILWVKSVEDAKSAVRNNLRFSKIISDVDLLGKPHQWLFFWKKPWEDALGGILFARWAKNYFKTNSDKTPDQFVLQSTTFSSIFELWEGAIEKIASNPWRIKFWWRLIFSPLDRIGPWLLGISPQKINAELPDIKVISKAALFRSVRSEMRSDDFTLRGRDAKGIEQKKIDESLSVIRGLDEDVTVTWVIPAYNETVRLRKKSEKYPAGENALRAKVRQLKELRKTNPKFHWRMILVDDGSPDLRTFKMLTRMRKWMKLDPQQVQVIRLDPSQKKGPKGGAVNLGMQKALEFNPARGAHFIGYTDMDLSTNLLLTGLMLGHIDTEGSNVAIGVRRGKGAYTEGRNWQAKLSSFLYNLAIRFLLPPLRNIRDTQAGFKLFYRPILEAHLSQQTDFGFSFDAELLLIAKLGKARVSQVPLAWFDSVSASQFAPQAVNRGFEALRTVWNLHRRHLINFKKMQRDIQKIQFVLEPVNRAWQEIQGTFRDHSNWITDYLYATKRKLHNWEDLLIVRQSFDQDFDEYIGYFDELEKRLSLLADPEQKSQRDKWLVQVEQNQWSAEYFTAFAYVERLKQLDSLDYSKLTPYLEFREKLREARRIIMPVLDEIRQNPILKNTRSFSLKDSHRSEARIQVEFDGRVHEYVMNAFEDYFARWERFYNKNKVSRVVAWHARGTSDYELTWFDKSGAEIRKKTINLGRSEDAEETLNQGRHWLWLVRLISLGMLGYKPFDSDPVYAAFVNMRYSGATKLKLGLIWAGLIGASSAAMGQDMKPGSDEALFKWFDEQYAAQQKDADPAASQPRLLQKFELPLQKQSSGLEAGAFQIPEQGRKDPRYFFALPMPYLKYDWDQFVFKFKPGAASQFWVLALDDHRRPIEDLLVREWSVKEKAYRSLGKTSGRILDLPDEQDEVVIQNPLRLKVAYITFGMIGDFGQADQKTGMFDEESHPWMKSAEGRSRDDVASSWTMHAAEISDEAREFDTGELVQIDLPHKAAAESNLLIQFSPESVGAQFHLLVLDDEGNILPYDRAHQLIPALKEPARMMTKQSEKIAPREKSPADWLIEDTLDLLKGEGHLQVPVDGAVSMEGIKGEPRQVQLILMSPRRGANQKPRLESIRVWDEKIQKQSLPGTVQEKKSRSELREVNEYLNHAREGDAPLVVSVSIPRTQSSVIVTLVPGRADLKTGQPFKAKIIYPYFQGIFKQWEEFGGTVSINVRNEGDKKIYEFHDAYPSGTWADPVYELNRKRGVGGAVLRFLLGAVGFDQQGSFEIDITRVYPLLLIFEKYSRGLNFYEIINFPVKKLVPLNWKNVMDFWTGRDAFSLELEYDRKQGVNFNDLKGLSWEGVIEKFHFSGLISSLAQDPSFMPFEGIRTVKLKHEKDGDRWVLADIDDQDLDYDKSELIGRKVRFDPTTNHVMVMTDRGAEANIGKIRHIDRYVFVRGQVDPAKISDLNFQIVSGYPIRRSESRFALDGPEPGREPEIKINLNRKQLEFLNQYLGGEKLADYAVAKVFENTNRLRYRLNQLLHEVRAGDLVVFRPKPGTAGEFKKVGGWQPRGHYLLPVREDSFKYFASIRDGTFKTRSRQPLETSGWWTVDQLRKANVTDFSNLRQSVQADPSAFAFNGKERPQAMRDEPLFLSPDLFDFFVIKKIARSESRVSLDEVNVEIRPLKKGQSVTEVLSRSYGFVDLMESAYGTGNGSVFELKRINSNDPNTVVVAAADSQNRLIGYFVASPFKSVSRKTFLNPGLTSQDLGEVPEKKAYYVHSTVIHPDYQQSTLLWKMWNLFRVELNRRGVTHVLMHVEKDGRVEKAWLARGAVVVESDQSLGKMNLLRMPVNRHARSEAREKLKVGWKGPFAGRHFEARSWQEIEAMLLRAASAKQLEVLYVDLDNTTFSTRGWHGSEGQIQFLLRKLTEKFGGEKNARSMAARLVFPFVDKMHAWMKKNGYFEPASGLDIEFYQQLQKKGVRIVAVTARPQKIRKETIATATAIFGEEAIHEWLFTDGAGKEKLQAIQKHLEGLGISKDHAILVDDFHENVEAVDALISTIHLNDIYADEKHLSVEKYFARIKSVPTQKWLRLEYALNALVAAKGETERKRARERARPELSQVMNIALDDAVREIEGFLTQTRLTWDDLRSPGLRRSESRAEPLSIFSIFHPKHVLMARGLTVFFYVLNEFLSHWRAQTISSPEYWTWLNWLPDFTFPMALVSFYFGFVEKKGRNVYEKTEETQREAFLYILGLPLVFSVEETLSLFMTPGGIGTVYSPQDFIGYGLTLISGYLLNQPWSMSEVKANIFNGENGSSRSEARTRHAEESRRLGTVRENSLIIWTKNIFFEWGAAFSTAMAGVGVVGGLAFREYFWFFFLLSGGAVIGAAYSVAKSAYLGVDFSVQSKRIGVLGSYSANLFMTQIVMLFFSWVGMGAIILIALMVVFKIPVEAIYIGAVEVGNFLFKMLVNRFSPRIQAFDKESIVQAQGREFHWLPRKIQAINFYRWLRHEKLEIRFVHDQSAHQVMTPFGQEAIAELSIAHSKSEFLPVRLKGLPPSILFFLTGVWGMMDDVNDNELMVRMPVSVYGEFKKQFPETLMNAIVGARSEARLWTFEDLKLSLSPSKVDAVSLSETLTEFGAKNQDAVLIPRDFELMIPNRFFEISGDRHEFRFAVVEADANGILREHYEYVRVAYADGIFSLATNGSDPEAFLDENKEEVVYLRGYGPNEIGFETANGDETLVKFKSLPNHKANYIAIQPYRWGDGIKVSVSSLAGLTRGIYQRSESRADQPQSLQAPSRLKHWAENIALGLTIPTEVLIALFAPLSAFVLSLMAFDWISPDLLHHVTHFTQITLSVLFFTHAIGEIVKKVKFSREVFAEVKSFLGPVEAALGIALVLFGGMRAAELLDHLGHGTMANEELHSRRRTYQYWGAVFAFLGVGTGIVLFLTHSLFHIHIVWLVHVSALVWGVSSVFGLFKRKTESYEERAIRDHPKIGLRRNHSSSKPLNAEQQALLKPKFQRFEEAMKYAKENTQYEMLVLGRHVRAAHNYFGLTHGRDLFAPPTVKGKQEGKQVKEHLRQVIEDIFEMSPAAFFSRVVSSDAERTYTVAKAAGQPEIDARLGEVPIYPVSGVPRDQAQQILHEAFDVFAAHPFRHSMKNVFSGAQLQKDLEAFLEREQTTTGHAFAATHGLIINLLIMLAMDIPAEQFLRVNDALGKVPTAGLTVLAFNTQNKKWELWVHGDDRYLSDDVRDRPPLEYRKKLLIQNRFRLIRLMLWRSALYLLLEKAKLKYVPGLGAWHEQRMKLSGYYPAWKDIWNYFFVHTDRGLQALMLERMKAHPAHRSEARVLLVDDNEARWGPFKKAIQQAQGRADAVLLTDRIKSDFLSEMSWDYVVLSHVSDEQEQAKLQAAIETLALRNSKTRFVLLARNEAAAQSFQARLKNSIDLKVIPKFDGPEWQKADFWKQQFAQVRSEARENDHEPNLNLRGNQRAWKGNAENIAAVVKLFFWGAIFGAVFLAVAAAYVVGVLIFKSTQIYSDLKNADTDYKITFKRYADLSLREKRDAVEFTRDWGMRVPPHAWLAYASEKGKILKRYRKPELAAVQAFDFLLEGAPNSIRTTGLYVGEKWRRKGLKLATRLRDRFFADMKVIGMSAVSIEVDPSEAAQAFHRNQQKRYGERIFIEGLRGKNYVMRLDGFQPFPENLDDEVEVRIPVRRSEARTTEGSFINGESEIDTARPPSVYVNEKKGDQFYDFREKLLFRMGWLVSVTALVLIRFPGGYKPSKSVWELFFPHRELRNGLVLQGDTDFGWGLFYLLVIGFISIIPAIIFAAAMSCALSLEVIRKQRNAEATALNEKTFTLIKQIADTKPLELNKDDFEFLNEMVKNTAVKQIGSSSFIVDDLHPFGKRTVFYMDNPESWLSYQIMAYYRNLAEHFSKIYEGDWKKGVLPQLNREIVKIAIEKGEIPLEKLPDDLRRFLKFLKENNLKDIVVFGGAVRDVFFGRQPNDFDVTLKMELDQATLAAQRVTSMPFPDDLYGNVESKVSALAKVLGVDVNKFMNKAGSEAVAEFHGKDLEYLGPVRLSQKNIVLRRYAVEEKARTFVSSASGAAILRLAIDVDGKIYGDLNALKELFYGRSYVWYDGSNFELGDALRVIELKHRYGLSFPEVDEKLAARVIKGYVNSPYLLNAERLHSLAVRLNRIIDTSMDKQSAVDELRRLGIYQLVEGRADFRSEMRVIRPETIDQRPSTQLSTTISDAATVNSKGDDEARFQTWLDEQMAADTAHLVEVAQVADQTKMKEEFKKEMNDLRLAVVNGSIVKAAPVIFYSHDIHVELLGLVKGLRDAFQTRPGSLNLAIVFPSKETKSEFEVELGKVGTNIHLLEQNTGSLIRLNRMIENKEWRGVVGIFFAPQFFVTGLKQEYKLRAVDAPGLLQQNVMPAVPKLIKFFSSTAIVNAQTLAAGLPEFAVHMRYEAEAGWTLLDSILETLALPRTFQISA